MAFDFIGYFAVPFLTVALSRETALFSTNFSSIRTANHRQEKLSLQYGNKKDAGKETDKTKQTKQNRKREERRWSFRRYLGKK